MAARLSGKAVPEPYGGIARSQLWTEAMLNQRFPYIRWRTPLLVATFSGKGGLACRICIARHGLLGSNVDRLPRTQVEFEAHMREFHP